MSLKRARFWICQRYQDFSIWVRPPWVSWNEKVKSLLDEIHLSILPLMMDMPPEGVSLQSHNALWFLCLQDHLAVSVTRFIFMIGKTHIFLTGLDSSELCMVPVRTLSNEGTSNVDMTAWAQTGPVSKINMGPLWHQRATHSEARLSASRRIIPLRHRRTTSCSAPLQECRRVISPSRSLPEPN